MCSPISGTVKLHTFPRRRRPTASFILEDPSKIHLSMLSLPPARNAWYHSVCLPTLAASAGDHMLLGGSGGVLVGSYLGAGRFLLLRSSSVGVQEVYVCYV